MSIPVSTLFSFDEFLLLVSSELLLADNKVSTNTVFRKLLGWSSLNALLLISKLNELFGIFISSADLAEITTLGEFYDLISKRVNGTK
ncbi:MAG: acyl carrier protein [bacterium]|nr:acyl carrier protein [bacterium]